MGAGKTTLIKELLSLMNVVDNVSSPTFSIINEYSTDKDETIYHMDLYRIEHISELDNIGFFEYLESGITCLIEWGEIIEELIDFEYDKFTITKEDNLRILKKNR
jgi:tRNA threonylcarbamoyladenosine biosynthesis protein TsaE